jgi:uncharacterized protein YjbI with pentapeptide repeats
MNIIKATIISFLIFFIIGANTISAQIGINEKTWTGTLANGRKINEFQFKKIMGKHEIWFNTEGAEGDKASLEAANLKDAELKKAILSFSSFKKANLQGANLENASIGLANFEETNLSHANLKGVRIFPDNQRGEELSSFYFLSPKQGAILQSANLEETNLANADLTFANLKNANLISANLQKASIGGANLEQANLSKANLEGAKMWEVNLQGASLNETYLKNAIMYDANLQETKLKGTNLEGTDLNKSCLIKVYISEAWLKETNLSEADLRNANIFHTNLFKANLKKANLKNAETTFSDFKEANLEGANATNSQMSITNFRGAILKGVDFENSDLSKSYFQGADLENANLQGANLEDSKLQNASLENVNLKMTNMKSADLQNALFELKPGCIPPVQTMSIAKNLSSLKYRKSPHSLVELRSAFKKSGLRKQEMEITYAIKHSSFQNSIENGDLISKMEAILGYLFFGVTCAWGMNPEKPLIILVCLIVLFAIPYAQAISSDIRGKRKKDGIWKVWLPERMRDDLGTDCPKYILDSLNPFFCIKYGFYFSLLSAFNIGWRDINVENWLSRIQPYEFRLQATGWVRIFSGIQSIIGVYLLALAILSYFGRPFESY